MPFSPSPERTLTASLVFQQLSKNFQRSMLAANKSPKTLETYMEGLRLFGEYLAAQGMPQEVAHIRREHVESFIAYLLERWKPATANNRYRALQQFFKWCLDGGRGDANRVPPKISLMI